MTGASRPAPGVTCLQRAAASAWPAPSSRWRRCAPSRPAVAWAERRARTPGRASSGRCVWRASSCPTPRRRCWTTTARASCSGSPPTVTAPASARGAGGPGRGVRHAGAAAVAHVLVRRHAARPGRGLPGAGHRPARRRRASGQDRRRPVPQAHGRRRRRRRARRRDAGGPAQQVPDGAARPARAAAPRTHRARRPQGARASRGGHGRGRAGAAPARRPRRRHEPDRRRHRLRLRRRRARRARGRRVGVAAGLLLPPVAARGRGVLAHVRRRRHGPLDARSGRTPWTACSRHELAHAYTVQWFGDDEEPPALLVEGIAQAAEGLPASSSLRAGGRDRRPAVAAAGVVRRHRRVGRRRRGRP